MNPKDYSFEGAEYSIYGIGFFLFCIVIGVFILAPMLPPWGQASADPETIARFYQENNLTKRIGLAIAMLGMPFIIPLFAVLKEIMARKMGMPLLGSVQYATGLAGVIFTFLMLCCWGTAAFRPDRNPEVTQALHDLGWLVATWVGSATMLQVLVIGIAVLTDNQREPVFPRWFGYYNLTGVLLVLPACVINIFHTGPFAYDGLLGFWVPYAGLFVWFAALMVSIRPAIQRFQAAD